MLDNAYFAKGALADHAAEGKMVQANCRTISATSSQYNILAESQFRRREGVQWLNCVPSSLRGAFVDWFAPIAKELLVESVRPELPDVDDPA